MITFITVCGYFLWLKIANCYLKKGFLFENVFGFGATKCFAYEEFEVTP